jgi:hypothetical protein
MWDILRRFQMRIMRHECARNILVARVPQLQKHYNNNNNNKGKQAVVSEWKVRK